MIDPALDPASLPRDGFQNAHVLVIGDLMLDRYVIGDVHRVSPEAPVPVVTVRRQTVGAGGAANVALNLAGLGARVSVAGAVGPDAAGESLLALLHRAQVDTAGVVTDPSRPTTSKTRVMCGSHQIVRFDDESTAALPLDRARLLLDRVFALLDRSVNMVLLSDYAKGVLSADLPRSVISRCAGRAVPVLVDPKRADYAPYAGATAITPNFGEFQTALAALSIGTGDIAAAGGQLRERLNCRMLLVTQGADGMTLIQADRVDHLAAIAQSVFDVSGAGDTVIATMAAAMAAGLDAIAAVRLANFAASVVVRKVGTVPISWPELLTAVAQ